MIELIENYEEALENAVTFNENLSNDEKLIRKLSNFKHWYYFEEIDKFAPSKFIGYKNMTLKEYHLGTDAHKGYMDGRETEYRLKNWFTKLDDASEKTMKLESMLSDFDKSPRKDFCIHIKK